MNDIQALKQNHELSRYVLDAGVKLARMGSEWRGLCPFHDERTPSFFVNDAKGVFNCFGCGAAGDLLDFLQLYHNADFAVACGMLADDFAKSPRTGRRNEATKAPKDADAECAARKIWAMSGPIPGTVAETYLETRGLPLSSFPATPWLRFTHTWQRDLMAEKPALVVAFTDDDQQVRGIQRIFLDKFGRKLSVPDPKLSRGSIRSNAVRLGDISSSMIICEGLEDGLSLWSAFPHRSVWVAGGTANLASLPIPETVTDLTVAADNDEAGLSAAKIAADAYLLPGRTVRISPPPAGFKDFNEMRMQYVG